MANHVYNFKLDLDFGLMNLLSRVDRFGGYWSLIEKREGLQNLRELKSIATVQSVGASTRIEGSKMTNAEVKALIFDNISINKLEERDQQEVLGYFNVLDIISDSYKDIHLSEASIKHLHNILMKFSDKDQWHKGKYKQHGNSVVATDTRGIKTTVFKTTPPGVETEDAMRNLIKWYNKDVITPPLIKSALFVYEFLSIHPFQDGNGRLSRLLGSLLLLKSDYPWIQYVSFENEIESRKLEYYHTLMECQHQRPNENVSTWILFFLNCLGNIQNKLMQKLEVQKNENQMSHREKMIYSFIDNHPGSKSGEIAKKLKLPLPTVKRTLAEMARGNFLAKQGSGIGTNYTTEALTLIKKNIVMTFSEKEKSRQFLLKNKHRFIQVTRIILSPKFAWKKPEEWNRILVNHGVTIEVTCTTHTGHKKKQTYAVSAFNNSFYYEPVFTLNEPIQVPGNLWEGIPNDNEFPINVSITAKCKKKVWQFDIMIVYDAALE